MTHDNHNTGNPTGVPTDQAGVLAAAGEHEAGAAEGTTQSAQRDAGERQIEVRRNVGLSALTGGFAAVLTVAFGVRAFGDGSALDWLLFGVLALVTFVHLLALVDGRAPLLVADDHGVRLRHGALWRGIAWDDIDCLEHLPRRGLRDGHVLVDGYDDQQLVVPLTLATTVRGVEADSLSDVLAELADGRSDVVEVVPGLAQPEDPSADPAPASEAGAAPAAAPAAEDTHDTHDTHDAQDETGWDGRGEARGDDVAPLSELHPDDLPSDVSPSDALPSDEQAPTAEAPRRGIAARLMAGLGGVAAARRATEQQADDHADQRTDQRTDQRAERDEERSDFEDTDEIRLAAPAWLEQSDRDAARAAQHADAHVADVETTDEIVLEEPPAPGRATVLPARVELDHETPARPVPTAGPMAPIPAGAPVGASAADAPLGDETVVLTGLAVQPAADPVIGPDLVAARQRLRLSIDQLSERTRIRPHVIEAMEVDDFGPCGGDFYARGHLRTLARVLGVDAGPMVAAYDERYAHAPVDPRRVFESELATGAGGAIRSTRGGRNWSVLIAAVMGAVLVWSVAQLVMGDPAPTAKAPVLNQSGGVTKAAAAKGDPVRVRLTAKGGGAQLVVRDGSGQIAFDGNLAFGQTTELRIVPPVRIWSSDGSVTYALGKDEAKPLGEIGAEVSKTLVAR
ncbi:helix-turn-helix domain-containing protein [Nocardioides sp. zg-536]|uniref:Helix-turn-helix domain-containing protein n=1 Tax=Nocardioides faecalis TaxID=2803858 RepID=A0A938Y4X3_9ACTN|nr:helix-turn-helix domain-containing protein [Nocardioides faecalis]MBM9460083.1 helix-turn-helix domain-containing protein [Nocardioides faecalis]QVI60120.1 helix-turn-helix domain-containing protein [Nocardioides faecalis]